MSKGERTRETILDEALRLARRDGFEALTIGRLSGATGLSKSGLFAHFGSKEALQIAVLESAEADFTARVIRPALAVERGEPRLRDLVERWMRWDFSRAEEGGCPFIQAAVEFDSREGGAREVTTATQERWLAFLAGAAQRAIDEGHFRDDVDPHQFAFELHAFLLGFHHARHLMRNPHSEARTRAAVEALFERCH